MFKGLSHLKVTYSQLLMYGVHIGHTFSNSLLFSAWLVYSYVMNVLIINLYKSIYQWKVGFVGLAAACKVRGPIWFINLHKGFSSIVQHASIMCGEMSWTDNWIFGFLSNYSTMARVFRKLKTYYSGAYRSKQKWVINNANEWLLSRMSWPRAIFVSSVYHSYWPVREALFLGTPCFGVVDTNVPCDYITIPFPGNDESLRCMAFYNDSVSNFILAKKFKLVIRWYMFLRGSKRTFSFKHWLSYRWSTDKFSLNLSLQNLKNIKLNLNPWKVYLGASDLFFSRNYGLDHVTNYFRVFDTNEYSEKDFSLLFKLYVRKNSLLLFKLTSLISIRDYWNSTLLLNLRKLLLPKSKKRFYFLKNFFVRRFQNNYFFKNLWRRKFPLIRLFGRKRRVRRSFFKSRKFAFIKKRFFFSFFNLRFLKYFFFVRFSNYKIHPINLILKHLHINILSSVLAPRFNINKSLNKYFSLSKRGSPKSFLCGVQKQNYYPTLFSNNSWCINVLIMTYKCSADILKIMYLIRRFCNPILNRYKTRLKKSIFRYYKFLYYRNLKKSRFIKQRFLKKFRFNLKLFNKKVLKKYNRLALKNKVLKNKKVLKKYNRLAYNKINPVFYYKDILLKKYNKKYRNFFNIINSDIFEHLIKYHSNLLNLDKNSLSAIQFKKELSTNIYKFNTADTLRGKFKKHKYWSWYWSKPKSFINLKLLGSKYKGLNLSKFNKKSLKIKNVKNRNLIKIKNRKNRNLIKIKNVKNRNLLKIKNRKNRNLIKIKNVKNRNLLKIKNVKNRNLLKIKNRNKNFFEIKRNKLYFFFRCIKSNFISLYFNTLRRIPFYNISLNNIYFSKWYYLNNQLNSVYFWFNINYNLSLPAQFTLIPNNCLYTSLLSNKCLRVRNRSLTRKHALFRVNLCLNVYDILIYSFLNKNKYYWV